jgi:hypothetical protein
LEQATKLRNLAKWYRALAEKAGEPWVWEARLRRAEELEREADLLAAQRPISSEGAEEELTTACRVLSIS